MGKPRTISFDASVSVVPKGRALEENGRVKKAQIRRSMSGSAVREVVCNTFPSLPCAKTMKDNRLTLASSQDLGGDEVVKLAGCGSV